LQAAALYAQLAHADQVNERRRVLWYRYQRELEAFCGAYGISLPAVPAGCEHNGHIFYVLMPDGESRDRVLLLMQAAGVQAKSHYLPLHREPAARKYACSAGDCPNAVRIAAAIIRLPIYYALTDADQQRVIDCFKAVVRMVMAAQRNGQTG